MHSLETITLTKTDVFGKIAHIVKLLDKYSSITLQYQVNNHEVKWYADDEIAYKKAIQELNSWEAISLEDMKKKF